MSPLDKFLFANYLPVLLSVVSLSVFASYHIANKAPSKSWMGMISPILLIPITLLSGALFSFVALLIFSYGRISSVAGAALKNFGGFSAYIFESGAEYFIVAFPVSLISYAIFRYRIRASARRRTKENALWKGRRSS